MTDKWKIVEKQMERVGEDITREIKFDMTLMSSEEITEPFLCVNVGVRHLVA